MKIRCKNCYRILNNDEEWCTRCGAHSTEVEQLMKSGIVPIDEDKIALKSILFYLLFAFVVNGILNVIFGIIFNSMNEGVYLGDETTLLPYAITYFSSINSLLISSIVTLGVVIIVNAGDMRQYLNFTFNKRTIVSLSIGLAISIGLVFLFKYTNFSIVPIYFKEYIMNPTADMLYKGSVSLIKIIIIMTLYMVVEELVFRKAFINYLDQVSLLSNVSIALIQSLVATSCMVLCYLLLVKTTLINYALFIVSNLVVNFLLGLNYFINGRTIVHNLIIRCLFIILFIVILFI